MALIKKVRGKSATSRQVQHEHSPGNEAEGSQEFTIEHYLDSIRSSDKEMDVQTRIDNGEKSKPELKVKRFTSQSSSYHRRDESQCRFGKVPKSSIRDAGALAWTPFATRTAVGFGEMPYPAKSMRVQKRHASAQNFRLSRCGSLDSLGAPALLSSSSASMVTLHDFSRRKSKKGYMEDSTTLCVRAFQNGSRDKSVRLTSKTLAQLLEEATGKLNLPSAGRMVFLSDGTPVTTEHQLYKDCSVHISMGETFKNPYEALRDKEKIRLSSSWNMNGIMLPHEKSISGKTKLSNRMKSLLESPKLQLLVLRNGESCEGVEIVLNRFDELLNACTRKLDLSSSARALFDWNGKKVQSFDDLFEGNTKSAMKVAHRTMLGPVWVTRGELFNPKGAFNYFTRVAIDLKRNLKKEKKNLENLQKHENKKEANSGGSELIEAGKKSESEELAGLIETLKLSLKDLQSRLKKLKKNCEGENVPNVNENSVNRLVGTKGYRLKLRLNGADSSETVLLQFSSKDLRMGKRSQKDSLLRFFDLLNGNESLKECLLGHGRRAVFKRAFLLNGTEMNDVDDLINDTEVWLSLGENFVPVEYDILGLTTDHVKAVNYWNQITILERQPWLDADDKLAKASSWLPITPLLSDDVKMEAIPDSLSEDKKSQLVTALSSNRLSDNGVFLQSGKDKSLVLYPEVQVFRKRREQHKDFWGEDARQWILSQDGTIANKCFKDLVLSVKDKTINIDDKDGQKIEGFVTALSIKRMTVFNAESEESTLQRRFQAIPQQQWNLTSNGHIVSAMHPNLLLTSIHELDVEIPQPLTNENGIQDAGMSSVSSSSGDGSSSETGDNDKLRMRKMKKKIKRKDRKKETKKKKWWHFSSSSSDGSEEDGDDNDDDGDNEGNARRRTNEDVKVRMKGTSSEEDKLKIGNEMRELNSGKEPIQLQVTEESDAMRPSHNPHSEISDICGGEKLMLGVFPKFDDQEPMIIRQRWAIKTQDVGSLLSSGTLSDKWTRQDLTWPVGEADTWIEDSISGYLLPCAPKLKRKIPSKGKSSGSFCGLPARLNVLRNGENNSCRAVTVIGPDLSSMKRKIQASLPLKWQKAGKGFQPVQSASVAEVEFEQFLDKCTEALNLPFAARRLFDKSGNELLASINTLERDQVVYISCGEQWIDPKLTYSEHQRRLLLAGLASDVNKIRNYVRLKEQAGFILEVDGILQAGSRIILGKRPSDEELHVQVECDSTLEDESMQNEIRALQSSHLTSHQISHIKSEERFQNTRERFQCDSGINLTKSTIEDNEIESHFSNLKLDSTSSGLKEPGAKHPPNAFRRWVFRDQFIQLKANKRLVIGVQQGDKSASVQTVILCDKNLEDPFQRWTISDLGFVHLKCNPQLVLTVATPSLQTDPFSDSCQNIGYLASHILLARRIDCRNGNSHQIFDMEENTAIVNAFSTSLENAEISAALKASVCTYSIFGSSKVYQPGYSLSEKAKSDIGSVLLCESCGKAVRGQLKLQKIQETIRFSCAMGSQKKHGLRTSGSFQCLSSQIDLSEHEAKSTLLVWERQLKRLQKESSVKVIAHQLNLATTTPAVRVLAHKNGDTGYREGVVVIANSINQFLDLCTYKLGLTQAARKLYTKNGDLIIDMKQLLHPYYPEIFLPLNKSAIESKQSSLLFEKGCSDTDKPSNCTSEHPLELSSVVSDATLSMPSKEGTDSGQSLFFEKNVPFIRVDSQNNEEDEAIRRSSKMDLRTPVDVWVSCGEPFVFFKDCKKLAERLSQDREERSIVGYNLEREKHRLRQVQGRRYAARGLTQNTDAEVKPSLKNVWKQPSKQEEKLEKSIEDLHLHMSELKSQQQQEFHNGNNDPRLAGDSKLFDRTKDRKLYDLPRGITVQVFPNGELVDRAVSIVASNLTELLEKATSRHDLNSLARRVFTKDGVEINDFDQIEKNQFVCVTCGEKFVPQRERRIKIGMRATWSRANRRTSLPNPKHVA